MLPDSITLKLLRCEYMQCKNKILFLSVGAIMLVHTIVPHVHHGEIAESEIINNKNNNPEIFRILQFVFHVSPSTYLKNVEAGQKEGRVSKVKAVKFGFADFINNDFGSSGNTVYTLEIPHVKAVISIIFQHFKGLRSPPFI